MSNNNNKSGSSRSNGGGRRRKPQGRNNRRSGPPKPKAPPKPTLGQKILQVLTFGMAGKPSANQNTGRPKSAPRRGSAEIAAENSDQDTSSDHRGGGGGGSNRGGGRGGRGGRGGGNSGSSRPPRKKRQRTPEIVEVTNPRLYVGNLNFDASESDLQELFGGFGTVQLAEIVTNQRSQRSKGYGFVEMLTVEEAKRAVDELHDKEFMGRPMVVSGAKSSGPKTASSA